MPATQTERFPTKSCTRCGGSGRYSYNQIDGDRCYGCSGTGRQFATRAIAEAAAAHQTAQRRLRNPLAQDLHPGDVVAAITGRPCIRQKGAVWATIATIRPTDRVSGHSLRNGEMVPTSYFMEITLEGCEAVEIAGNQVIGRKVTA